MTPEAGLILAAAAQVVLTAVALALLGRARVQAVRRGAVRLDEVATDRNAWPRRLHKLANNVSNQFETPVLYFAAVAIALAAGVANWGLVALAWAWLGTRAVHMGIHVGANDVERRFVAFTVGLVVLAVLWVAVVAAAVARG